MRTARSPIRSTTLVVLAIGFACLATPLDAGPLPRLALSIGQPADAGRIQQSCRSIGDALFIVPAGTVTVGGEATTSETARQVIAAVPKGSALFLQLDIATAGGAAIDEAALDARLTAFVSALPLASAKGLVLKVAPPVNDARALQFAIAMLVVKARAVSSGLVVTLALPAGASTTLADLARRAATYADAVAIPYRPGWRDEAAFVERTLHKTVMLRVGTEPADADARERYLDALVEAGDLSLETVWVDWRDAEGAATLCAAVSTLASAIPSSAAAAQRSNLPVSVTIDGAAVQAMAAFLDSQTANLTLLVRTSATGEQPLPVTVASASGKPFEMTCADTGNGRSLPVTVAAGSGQAPARSCSSIGPHTVVSVRWANAETRMFESENVTGRATLSVEEIVARWQQTREAERRLFLNAMSACLLSLHFEPTGLGGGFDVALELKNFLDRTGVRDWVQTGFFLNGVRLKGRREFPLPQLEPEKVVSQPLDLRLDEKYSYSLDGTDAVDGVLCYVIRIEPKQSAETLYRGRIWIDGMKFRQVRAQLEQQGGRSNVISHVETQDFHLVPDAEGHQFNVLRRIYIQEILNAAGRSFLLEKTLTFSGYVLNGDGFTEALAQARASEDPMFRDTGTGLHALKKDGAQRIVDPSDTKRMRSLIMGTFYDGTFAFPIPLAGLSLVDFDWRHTGNQLSLFWAGPIVAADLSRQISRKVRFGVDFALSGVPQNRRVYVGNDEVKAQGLWVFGETVGGLLGWQPLPRVSLSGSSYATFNVFRATGDTSPLFRVPNRGYTFENTAEARYVNRGFALTGSVLRGDRVGWGAMGYADQPSDVQTSYLKYSVEASKQAYVGTFTKFGLYAGYFSGDNLDRFSRYYPSFLSKPRVRGIPSGTDSFDDIGIAGVSYGFNVMELVKFEGAYNHAWARNNRESNRFKNFDGIEGDIGTGAPWNTFLQGTVSYALRGNTARYHSRWSVYVLLLKPLGR